MRPGAPGGPRRQEERRSASQTRCGDGHVDGDSRSARTRRPSPRGGAHRPPVPQRGIAPRSRCTRLARSPVACSLAARRGRGRRTAVPHRRSRAARRKRPGERERHRRHWCGARVAWPGSAWTSGRPNCPRPVNRAKGRLAAALREKTGGDLLSREVALRVPSAQAGLTSLFGMGRGVSPPLSPPETVRERARSPRTPSKLHSDFITVFKSRPRVISTGPLNTLLCLHVPPINVVVSHDPYSLEGMGGLISRWASRLDAFSGYPIQTWLTSSAVGTTTDTPEVCSSRSSRTRDDSSQASNAHGG